MAKYEREKCLTEIWQNQIVDSRNCRLAVKGSNLFENMTKNSFARNHNGLIKTQICWFKKLRVKIFNPNTFHACQCPILEMDGLALTNCCFQ